MSEGWGDDDAWGSSGGGGAADVAPKSGGGGGDGCRKCGEDGHFARECPSGGGGGGDNKCRNCKQEGHMANDCPEPEVCRRCREEGHKVAECPMPQKCFNCREEGHATADCPEPVKCRRCKKEGHMVSECPEPQVCNNCGQEGHMQRDCSEPEKTRQYVDEEGNTKESYVPKDDIVAEELFKLGITSGINFSKYENIPVSVTGDNIVQAVSSFENANLRPLLMENITKSGYKVPTPIQKNSIPIIMAGRDLMACAQTGSGKTAAFLIPIIHRLIGSDADPGVGASSAAPQALVITPTRELAIQIYNEARKFAQGSNIKTVVAYGGTSTGFQARKLQQGCNILVATPGRLLDNVEKGRVSFKNLEFFVLDEADRMMDMGFMPEIQKCSEDPNMPEKGKRQTLMFSATFPDDIQTAAQDFLHDYLFLTVGLVGGACSDVEQIFHQVEKHDKREKLEELLNDPERDPKERTLIFVQTKKNTDFLATHLSQEGLPTTSINYDMPDDVDEYVYRIGRVGNVGKATSFYDPEQDGEVAGKLVKLLADAGVAIPDWLEEAGAGGGGDAGNGGGAGGDDDDDWD